MDMKTREAGFTLIESILLLMITASLLLVPMLSINKMIDSIQTDLFFRELTSNITLMQNHAILNGETTSVQFVPGAVDQVRFRVNNQTTHPLNRELKLENGLYELRGREYSTFSFARDTGNISQANTRAFRTTQGDYELTYWLGSGRFEITKTADK